MKCAMFPSQHEALARRVAEIRAEGRRQLSRRTVLGLGVGGFFGITSGSLVTLGVTTHRLSGVATHPARLAAGGRWPELAWARDLAVGRLVDLLDAQAEYVEAVSGLDERDEVLWVGVLRLANAVIDDHPRAPRDLGGRLLPLASRRDVPAGLCHLLRLIGTR